MIPNFTDTVGSHPAPSPTGRGPAPALPQIAQDRESRALEKNGWEHQWWERRLAWQGVKQGQEVIVGATLRVHSLTSIGQFSVGAIAVCDN